MTFRRLHLIFARLRGWLVRPPRSDDAKGQVTLGLAPLEALARQDLVACGLTIAGKIPVVHATFALFPSKSLVKAQMAYRLISDLKIVLPVVTLMLPGLGVFIARRPRRALIGAGLGFAASMPVLAAALLIAIVLLVMLGLIEVIGRPPAQPSPAPHPPTR